PLPRGGRVLVFAWGMESSGVSRRWAAGAAHPGVNHLPDLSDDTLQRIARQIGAFRRAGDSVIASLHWGPNWGYRIPSEHRHFARRLIDHAGVDLIHGHSSHHPLGLEVYKGRLILYGCGDLLNDYEGIGGYEEFRGELSLFYLPTLDRNSGHLTALRMLPMRIRRFRLQRASLEEASWLCQMLVRESANPGYALALDERNQLKFKAP
ncbi:MAG TPA: poly-gamma-glutamate biosynthesis protein, partial [Chromatiales bacterium]|nr:poly-gamma-glutamate biosynthesis protein [Chromatiales bacterium]